MIIGIFLSTVFSLKRKARSKIIATTAGGSGSVLISLMLASNVAVKPCEALQVSGIADALAVASDSEGDALFRSVNSPKGRPSLALSSVERA